MTKVKVGDIIVLKEEISVLGKDYVGKKFTVTSIDDKYIYFKSGFGAGGMGHDEFDKFFKVVKHTEEKETEVETKKSKPTLKSKIKLIFKGMK